MADQVKFDIEPGGESGGTTAAAPTLPKELEGKTPADIWKMVEEERARGAAAEQARRRAEQVAQEIAMAALEGRNAPAAQPSATPAATEPDRETDPDAWMAFQVKKQVHEAVKPLVDSYTRDRSVVMSSTLEAAKARVASQFHDWKEHQAAIEEFVRNYPPEVLAQPGALEEAYYRVKGRVVAEREREQRIREQASVESQGRVGVSPERPTAPQMSDEQKRVATNLGIDAESFQSFEGPGVVSIDDYLQAKAAAAAKATGGRNAAR